MWLTSFNKHYCLRIMAGVQIDIFTVECFCLGTDVNKRRPARLGHCNSLNCTINSLNCKAYSKPISLNKQEIFLTIYLNRSPENYKPSIKSWWSTSAFFGQWSNQWHQEMDRFLTFRVELLTLFKPLKTMKNFFYLSLLICTCQNPLSYTIRVIVKG